jgi:hypothetical protein
MENELTAVEASAQLHAEMLKNCSSEYMSMCENRSDQIIDYYITSESGKVFLSFLALKIMAKAESPEW